LAFGRGRFCENTGKLTCRKIIQDVGPTLLPDEEISDLAAAEGAVNEKVAERNAMVEKLGEEFRRMCTPSSLSDNTLSICTDP
jgi:hypothetical protein